jgi:hypothetical protein
VSIRQGGIAGEERLGDAVAYARLRNSAESFGLVVDYLARVEPFSRYDLGNFVMAVKAQLGSGCHVAATRGGRLVGYCGWLATTDAVAAAWAAGEGQLRPSSPGAAGAAAVTIVAAETATILRPLIRAARAQGPGWRLYFKRQYAASGRPARKSSVENVG